MNFRAALRVMASPEMSEDDSADPTVQDARGPDSQTNWQPGVRSDGQDPASSGGPSPFNGAEPQESEPVVSDPLWSDPTEPNVQGKDMPHVRGPNDQSPTLHNARRARYDAARERVSQE